MIFKIDKAIYYNNNYCKHTIIIVSHISGHGWLTLPVQLKHQILILSEQYEMPDSKTVCPCYAAWLPHCPVALFFLFRTMKQKASVARRHSKRLCGSPWSSCPQGGQRSSLCFPLTYIQRCRIDWPIYYVSNREKNNIILHN